MLQPSDLPIEAVSVAAVPPARQAADDYTVLWDLLDDLQDGVLLVDADGTIALATRRAAKMFGYPTAELTGRPVEFLIPAARLGRHRNGTAFPVEVSRSQVTIASGHLTLITIREVAQGWRLGNLARLPRATSPDPPAPQSSENPPNLVGPCP
ncbi:MAG TPA: PAS domain S-box protein [Streptosporangiaceae bacterium]|jgi:PAS domain-containing protein